RRTRAGNVCFDGVVGCRLVEGTGPPVAEEVHRVAARVEALRSVGETDAPCGDADVAPGNHPRQPLERLGSHNRVLVHQRDDVAGGEAGAEVAATGEAEVASGPHHSDSSALSQPIHRVVRARVVDDDHLDLNPCRGERRYDATLQPRVAAVGQDHDADPRCRHSHVCPSRHGDRAAGGAAPGPPRAVHSPGDTPRLRHMGRNLAWRDARCARRSWPTLAPSAGGRRRRKSREVMFVTIASMSSRLVDRAGAVLESRTSRRGFLIKSTMAASALTVSPWRYLVRPGSAYASIYACAGSSCDCGPRCRVGYIE